MLCRYHYLPVLGRRVHIVTTVGPGSMRSQHSAVHETKSSMSVLLHELNKGLATWLAAAILR